MPKPPSDRKRVMVDANVLIAGMGWPRFPYEVLHHAAQGDFQLVLTPFIIDEVREHITRLFPDELETFEELLATSQYEEVKTPPQADLDQQAGFVRDINDIPVALAAITAQVDCLVSSDKDLTEENESTKELHQRLTIVLPGTFLREYMGWSSEQLEAIRKRNWQDLETNID